MSYCDALTAAGATILDYTSYGSYQGTWVAKVEFTGKRGWVIDSYGSCSGCDAFEAEFDYNCDRCEDHWCFDDDCEECLNKRNEYNNKLAAFGMRYLECMYTQEEAEKYCAQYADWSVEDAEMLEYVKNNPI